MVGAPPPPVPGARQLATSPREGWKQNQSAAVSLFHQRCTQSRLCFLCLEGCRFAAASKHYHLNADPPNELVPFVFVRHSAGFVVHDTATAVLIIRTATRQMSVFFFWIGNFQSHLTATLVYPQTSSQISVSSECTAHFISSDWAWSTTRNPYIETAERTQIVLLTTKCHFFSFQEFRLQKHGAFESMGYFAAAVVEEAGPVTDVLSNFHDRAAHSQTP
jgi:hypothetical protein